MWFKLFRPSGFSLIILILLIVFSFGEDFSNSRDSEVESLQISKGFFLNLFTSCTVDFVGDFSHKSRQSQGEGEEKEKYWRYFLKQSPVMFHDVSSGIDTVDSVSLAHLRKYSSSCTLKLYFLYDLLSARGGVNFSALSKLLESSVKRGENPEYIGFVKTIFGEYKNRLHSSIEHVQSEKSFYANLYRVTLTSKYFVIDGIKRTVSLVCMHCSIYSALLEPLDSRWYESMFTLEQKWQRVHENLNGRSIEIFRRRDPQIFESGQCSMRNMIRGSSLGSTNSEPADGIFNLDEAVCSIVELSKAMNMTPYPTDHRLYGHVKFGVMMYADYGEKMFLKRDAPAKYVWSSTAESFELFTFLTLKRKRIDLKAVWRPFQPELWKAIFASFIGLAILFGLSIGSRYEIAKTHFINAKFSFLLFTAIILEQKQLNIWKIRKQLTSVSIVIVTTWTLVALVISSLYRSSIYSVLATLLPPPAPSSLMDLASNNTFVATTTTFQFQGEAVSPFHGILDEKIAFNDSHADLFTKMKETVHFIPIRPGKLLKSYQDMLVGFKRRMIILDSFNETNEYYIPRDFTLIGPESELKIISQLFTAFKKYTFVIKNPSTTSNFVNRTPWVIRRNFFFRLFHRRLCSLYESGIYMEWKTYVLLRRLEEEWMVSDSANLNGTKSIKNHVLELASRESNPELHSEPWPLAAFATVLVLWSVCINNCFLIFSIEWIAIAALRFFFNVRRNTVRHMKI